MTERPLTEQQLAFCLKFIENGGNGSQAASDVGYAAAGARVRACRLLKDPRVRAKIAELTARASSEATAAIEAAGVTAIAEQALTAEAERSTIDTAVASLKDRVLRRLESLGLTELPELATWTADEVKFIPSAELSAAARGSIQSVKAKIDEVITDEGDKILRRTTMEVKQHNPMPAVRELMKLVGLQPADEKPKAGAVAVGVQVIVSGGPTGIEAGSQTALIVPPIPPVVSESAPIVPPAVPPASNAAPRPWKPARRAASPMSAVAARARAALSHASLSPE